MSATTIWEVWNPEEGETKEIYGFNARYAAESYRDKDPDDWEAGEVVTLAVRKKGATEWEFFDVRRGYDPVYSAASVDRPEGFEMPDEEGGAE